MLIVGFGQIMDFVQLVFVNQVVPLPCLDRFLDRSCFLRGLIHLDLLSDLKKFEFNLDWLCIIERLTSTAHRYQYYVFFSFEFLKLELVIALRKSCFDLHVLVQQSFQADS